MKLRFVSIALLGVCGFAASAHAESRSVELKALSERWIACVDAKSWDWLEDLDWKTSDEVRQLRGTLNEGQMFVRVMDQCREHLAAEKWAWTDSLSPKEMRRFILDAQKRFQSIADAIRESRDNEGL